MGGKYEEGIPIKSVFFSIYCNQSNGLNQGGEKEMDSGYVLKVDSIGLTDGLDEGSEGKRK